MPTTSNFGWTTPADTDYVKDGALAIRTLANGIDTSLVDLKGGTTGQILSKNSNTDLDYTWINNDQGDITNVAVTSPITGGGSSGSVTIGIQDGTTAQKGAVQLENSISSTSTTTAAVPASVKSAYDLANGAIAKTLIDAKADLIVGTAADTVGRLAVGSNNQVLTVDSSTATGLKWAAAGGGWTYLGTAGTSGGSELVSELFSTTYDRYFLVMKDVQHSGGNLRFQWYSSGAPIAQRYYGNSGANTNSNAGAFTLAGTSRANKTSAGYLFLETNMNATSTSYNYLYGHYFMDAATYQSNSIAGWQDETGGISGFRLSPSAGTMSATIYVYGITKS